jgi:hypothetical protein
MIRVYVGARGRGWCDLLVRVASVSESQATGQEDAVIRDLKAQAKRLLKTFKSTSPAQCTIDTGTCI